MASLKKLFSASVAGLKKVSKCLETVAFVLIVMFIYNPLVFIPLAIIKPRKAAAMLYGDLGFISDLLQMFYRPFVAMLPFCHKKYFMEKNGIYKYSPELQVKYVVSQHFAPGKIVSLIKQMSNDGVALLWQQNPDKSLYYQCIIRADKILTEEQFSSLLEFSNLACEYVEKHTPSEDMLKMILKANLGNIFSYCIRNYGLSAKMVNFVYSFAQEMSCYLKQNEFKKGLIGVVKEDLKCYSDRQIVRKTRNSNSADSEKIWQEFLKDIPCPSAQSLMVIWQYDMFHSVGYKLDKVAIENIFSCGEISLCRKVFEYEDTQCFSDKALALINANPALKELMLLTSK